MVQQHHVDVADVEFFKRLVNGVCGIGKLVWVELGYDEKFLSGHAAFAYGLPDLAFVAVDVGGVDEANAVFDGRFECVDALAAVQAIGSDAVDGHLAAIIELHGFFFQIKSAPSRGIGIEVKRVFGARRRRSRQKRAQQTDRRT